MKPAAIVLFLLLAALPVLATPGLFTVTGSAFCYSHDTHQPGIRLTWPPSAGAATYEVYKNGIAQQLLLPFAVRTRSSSPTTAWPLARPSRTTRRARQLRRLVHLEYNRRFIPGDACQVAPAQPVLDGSAAYDPTGPRAIVNLPAGMYYFFLSFDDEHISGDINPSNDVKRSTALTFPKSAVHARLYCHPSAGGTSHDAGRLRAAAAPV
jgi:hypothetical protein